MAIYACGSGIIGEGQACNGANVSGLTCASLGYASGKLACKSNCLGFDVSQCVTGKTVVAKSCSQFDVQNAVNSASPGDTVMVPAGTCTYTSPVIYVPSVNITKPLTLEGAGIGNTIINAQIGGQAFETAILLSSGDRLTGFTITGTQGASTGIVQVNGQNFRIDHDYIDVTGSSPGISTSGQSSGVIDHDTFINGNPDLSITGAGASAWNFPDVFGTGNTIIIENDTFNHTVINDGAVDAYNGANWVFRYNKVIGEVTIGNHGLDSGGQPSPRDFEVYNNTFYNPYGHWVWPMNFRGGTGVIFNNNVSAAGGSFDSFAILESYRSCASLCSGGLCATWGLCNGTNPIDQNRPGQDGYACYEQVSRTIGQMLLPVFAWNNMFKGQPGAASIYAPSCPVGQYILVANRDYYNNQVTYNSTSGYYQQFFTGENYQTDYNGVTQQWNYKPYVYPSPLTQFSAVGIGGTTTSTSSVSTTSVSTTSVSTASTTSVSTVSTTSASTIVTTTIFQYGSNTVPIILTNSQGSSTGSGFQQMVTFNPTSTSYKTYEAADLGNIRFAQGGLAPLLVVREWLHLVINERSLLGQGSKHTWKRGQHKDKHDIRVDVDTLRRHLCGRGTATLRGIVRTV